MAEITKIQLKTKLTRDDYVYLYNEDLWQCLDDVPYTAASNIKYIESPAIINPSIRLHATESSLASLEIPSSDAIGYKNAYSRNSFELKQGDGSYIQNEATADLDVDNYPIYIISPLTFVDKTIDVCIKINNKNSANNYPFEIYSVASTLSIGETLNNSPLPEVLLAQGEPLVNTNDNTVIIGTSNADDSKANDSNAIVLGNSSDEIALNDGNKNFTDPNTNKNKGIKITHKDGNKVRYTRTIEGKSAKVTADNNNIEIDVTYTLTADQDTTDSGKKDKTASLHLIDSLDNPHSNVSITTKGAKTTVSNNNIEIDANYKLETKTISGNKEIQLSDVFDTSHGSIKAGNSTVISEDNTIGVSGESVTTDKIYAGSEINLTDSITMAYDATSRALKITVK